MFVVDFYNIWVQANNVCTSSMEYVGAFRECRGNIGRVDLHHKVSHCAVPVNQILRTAGGDAWGLLRGDDFIGLRTPTRTEQVDVCDSLLDGRPVEVLQQYRHLSAKAASDGCWRAFRGGCSIIALTNPSGIGHSWILKAIICTTVAVDAPANEWVQEEPFARKLHPEDNSRA